MFKYKEINMYKEWFAAEIFSQNFPIQDWVTGKMVYSTNEYFAGILVYNLSPNEKAKVKVTYYYSDETPKDYEFTIQPSCQGRLFSGLNRPDNVPGCNPQKRFGLHIQSTVQVVAQATVWERVAGSTVTNSMTTFMLHPGPLGKAEHDWCLVDSLTLRSESSLEEREWLTILNPNNQPVNCRFGFFPGSRIDPKTLSTMLESDQIKSIDFSISVPGESILSTLQSDIPGLEPNKPYTIVASCDLPVVMQGLRQIFVRGDYQCMKAFAVLDAIPVGHVVNK
jgi:hypothetical protein